MKSKSELNMEIEQLEKECDILKKLEKERDALRIELEDYKILRESLLVQHFLNCEKLDKIKATLDKAFDIEEDDYYPWLKTIREILDATTREEIK